MYSFLLEGVDPSALGQFNVRAFPSLPPGRLQIPTRAGRLRIPPRQPVPTLNQYSVQVYELPTVGFSSVFAPSPQWRQLGNATYSDYSEAEAAFNMYCSDIRDCDKAIADLHRQGSNWPLPTSPQRCLGRGPIRIGTRGNRQIVRLLGTTDNFQTSRVMQECDVPDWTHF